MDVLKKLSTFVFSFILVFQGVQSQNQEELLTAFTRSYSAESAANYHKAIEVLKKVYSKDSYEVNLRLGWLSFKANQLQESEDYYQRAIQIMPYGIEARFGLANPLAASGKWDLLLQNYEQLLKIDPQNSVANFRIGLLYYEKANYLLAEKHFGKVANLHPFDYDGLHMLAWTKLKLGKTSEAKSLFQKALLYKPGDSSCLEGLSLIR